MAEHRISNIIKNLSNADEKEDERFSIPKQLEKAMAVIDPHKTDNLSADQRIAKTLIIDAVYLAHLSCLRYYQVNDALVAMSRLQSGLSMMTREMSVRRPRIPLIGIAASDRLMPVAFQSEAEATSYKDAIQVALGNGDQMLHLTHVELSTTVVDNIPVKPVVKPPSKQKVENDLKILEEKLQETLPNPPLKVKK